MRRAACGGGPFAASLFNKFKIKKNNIYNLFFFQYEPEPEDEGILYRPVNW
jgi:hypothetical protein